MFFNHFLSPSFKKSEAFMSKKVASITRFLPVINLLFFSLLIVTSDKPSFSLRSLLVKSFSNIAIFKDLPASISANFILLYPLRFFTLLHYFNKYESFLIK